VLEPAAQSEPSQPGDPPRTLKKYALLGKLATGGMAELFLARANGLGGFERLLVIKRILPSLAGDTEFVRMLLDEARIAATLQHSNVVQVFDVDMDDGAVFFVMEHLHGHDVAELLRRARAASTRVPLENAIAIAVAVAAGLHYAHERWGPDGTPLDIVHRDVSPHNVVVTYDGNVKLIDFGIAKAANRLSHTRFGIFKGKLPYASPEQCRCEPIDRRTDVYSLGVLLYELTTGFPVFEGSNEFELMRLMSEAVFTRPRMRDKEYPRELEQIVVKALARDPADRYQTAQALQRDLEVFAGRAGLDLSAFSLSRLVEQLFASELARWQDSRRAGMKLEDHLSRQMDAVAAPDTDTDTDPDTDPEPEPDAEPEPDTEPELADTVQEPSAAAITQPVRRAFPHRPLIAAGALAAVFAISVSLGLVFAGDRGVTVGAATPAVTATAVAIAAPAVEPPRVAERAPVALPPVVEPITIEPPAPVTPSAAPAPVVATPHPAKHVIRPATAKHVHPLTEMARAGSNPLDDVIPRAAR
jgi:serine/threonine protein kinase